MDWTISEKRAYEFVSAPTIEHLVQELNKAAENGYELCGGPMQKGSLYYCIVIQKYTSEELDNRRQLGIEPLLEG